ncbi:MAG: hypothetical protein CL677_01880 [Bdellovibrionaceae bacterium]|nr:hypothetical protein [Pseudobdellovibrionaceae bacterium]|tara:strand:- start:112868 stop:113761 length:894 start_codon:yes stop_codon:yes gene_type:complete
MAPDFIGIPIATKESDRKFGATRAPFLGETIGGKMKFLVKLTIGLIAVVAIQAKAQTPADVCRKITQLNSSRGAECAALLSRHRFSPASSEICMIAANSSSLNGLQCMQTAADKYVAPEIAPTCKKIASLNASRAATCITAAADSDFSGGMEAACLQAAHSSSLSGVQCVQAVAGNFYDPAATPVCVQVARLNASRATDCAVASANKIYPNGTASICLEAARSSSLSGVQCMNQSGLDYDEEPPPSHDEYIEVTKSELREIVRMLRRGQRALDNGNTQRAGRLMQNSQQALQDIIQQ